MAQEGSEASVASTSTNNPNWWDVHANAISSSWNSWQQQQQQQQQQHHHHHLRNPSSSSCDEDISSFTNATNLQSGLSIGSSAVTDLTEEATVSENHLWSQFLSTGSGGNDHRHLNNNHGNHEEIFHETMSSKNLTPAEMFGPACDYLKKLDETWDQFSPPTSFSTLEKQLNNCNSKLIDQEGRRPTNLSDLVSNWSIAPPQQQFIDRQIGLQPNLSQIKPEIPNSSSSYNSTYGLNGSDDQFFLNNTSYENESKGECQQQDQFGGQRPSFLRTTCANDGLGLNRVCLGNSTSGILGRYLASPDGFGSNTRNFSDLINFGESVHKQQLIDRHIPKSSSVRELDQQGKQGHVVASSTAKANLKGTSANEGKKKRSEDTSDAALKKTKHEGSNTSSAKLQVPKVKLGEKITALQQIVSPFGKTDTASVLLEAINYIRFLHEQVQLLSDHPYMKSGLNNKDVNSWGGVDRKDKQEVKLDLSSRGLCLVPISCTPQIYRENTGTDYWIPAYRGCLYR